MGIWVATQDSPWEVATQATRHGIGQVAVLVACQVADEVPVETAEQVASVVPREVPWQVTWEAMR